MQQSRNLLASNGVVKFRPHSCSHLESFQCTKHSDACVIRVPISRTQNTEDAFFMYILSTRYSQLLWCQLTLSMTSQVVPTPKLFTAKTLHIRNLHGKMKVTNIGNLVGILLHKFLYQCAHVCENVCTRSNHFEVTSKVKCQTSDLENKSQEHLRFGEVGWPNVVCWLTNVKPKRCLYILLFWSNWKWRSSTSTIWL